MVINWFGDELERLLKSFAMRELTQDQRALLNELSMALVGKVFPQEVDVKAVTR